MKDEKHIDKLFKDRFKDFEASPSPEVWGSIQASLESRKKNRKIIPLFWKVGGVAALLALLFTIGNSIYNASKVNTSVVTNDEAIEQVESIHEKPPLIKDNLKDNVKVATEDGKSDVHEESVKNSSEIKVAGDVNHVPIQKEPKYIKHKEAVSKKTSEKTPNQTKSFIKTEAPAVETHKEAVAIASEKQKTSDKIYKEIVGPLNMNESLIKKEIGISETTKTEVAANETTGKQSILDAINEQNAIKSEEAVAQEKSKIDTRWELAPNFAPVYYSSLSEGSSIDPSFSDNSQSSAVNFSYGVQVSYAVSERLSIRSGISNVDLSYSTGGVELGTGPVSSALRSVNYKGRQNVLTVLDEGSIEAQNTANGGFGTVTQKSTNGAAELVQNITYYEVPLELKYAVIKTKVGVNVIGGVSTLFLGNNDVSVAAGDFSSTLGEANNLSTVSFTTNIGLGVDYKISKKFKFNVEPMFKYQLNPYSDSSVDFQPYYIGVYTGLSYKF
ncbi:MAG: hypothetical protein ACI9M9_001812 [Flavobacteriaceae bacterium]|jgi:hypothetical protein